MNSTNEWLGYFVDDNNGIHSCDVYVNVWIVTRAQPAFLALNSFQQSSDTINMCFVAQMWRWQYTTLANSTDTLQIQHTKRRTVQNNFSFLFGIFVNSEVDVGSGSKQIHIRLCTESQPKLNIETIPFELFDWISGIKKGKTTYEQWTDQLNETIKKLNYKSDDDDDDDDGGEEKEDKKGTKWTFYVVTWQLTVLPRKHKIHDFISNFHFLQM